MKNCNTYNFKRMFSHNTGYQALVIFWKGDLDRS